MLPYEQTVRHMATSKTLYEDHEKNIYTNLAMLKNNSTWNLNRISMVTFSFNQEFVIIYFGVKKLKKYRKSCAESLVFHTKYVNTLIYWNIYVFLTLTSPLQIIWSNLRSFSTEQLDLYLGYHQKIDPVQISLDISENAALFFIALQLVAYNKFFKVVRFFCFMNLKW